jgi:predicted PurR-regulated permease PerM
MGDPAADDVPAELPAPAGEAPRARWAGFRTDRRRPPPEREEALRYLESAALRVSLVVAGVAVGTLVGVLLLWRLRVIVLLIFVAMFVTALLHPAVSFLDRRGFRRGASTGIVFVLAAAVIGGVGYLLFHPVYTSATRFANELPTLVKQAQQGKGQIGRVITRLHLLNYVKQHAPQLETAITKLGKPALALGKTVVSGAVALVTIGVLTFFLLLEAPKLTRGILNAMRPDRSLRLRAILEESSRTVGGYMLGNLATSVIAGVVVFVSLVATGVPFAAVLAIWVALVDFLPLVGGLLAGVPTVLLAFLHSFTAGIVTLIVFLVYQQVENHVLNPVIMSRTVRLDALWVLLAILIGAELGGLVGSEFGGLLGALLAVPTAGAIQVVAKDVWAHRQAGRSGVPPDGAAAATGAAPVVPANRGVTSAGGGRGGERGAE